MSCRIKIKQGTHQNVSCRHYACKGQKTEPILFSFSLSTLSSDLIHNPRHMLIYLRTAATAQRTLDLLCSFEMNKVIWVSDCVKTREDWLRIRTKKTYRLQRPRCIGFLVAHLRSREYKFTISLNFEISTVDVRVKIANLKKNVKKFFVRNALIVDITEFDIHSSTLCSFFHC